MATRPLARSGPGRGTPQSRTAARPGERVRRSRNAQHATAPSDATGVETQPERSHAPRVLAGRITWRLIVLVAVVLGLAIVLGQSLRIYFTQAAELAEVREEIAQRQEEIAEHSDEINRWEDPEYVRSQARVRLGWVMPGEVGYRVIGPDGKPLDGSETIGTEESESEGPWYDRMWESVKVADAPVSSSTPAAEADADDRVIGDESSSPSANQTPSSAHS